jgi:hypothetical protein
MFEFLVVLSGRILVSLVGMNQDTAGADERDAEGEMAGRQIQAKLSAAVEKYPIIEAG